MTTPNNTVASLPAKMGMHSPALIIRYGVDYLDGWNSAVEAMQAALASPAPSAPVVDDAMVERVVAADDTWCDDNSLSMYIDSADFNRARLSHALTAALSGVSAPAAEQDEVARLRHVIERDRTVFCGLIVRCKNVLAGRKWLGDEHARAAGGYAYDEPGFIREFGQAWTEIMGELERMHRVFQDFSDCPRGEALRAAQADAERALAPQPEARGVEGMRNALEAIRQYGSDTLSGRVDGPSDREWFKEGVREMTRRAREALATPNPVVACANAPVRAEQPEGKEANWLAERIAKWQETYPDSESSWVDKSDAAVEILEEYGDLICQLASSGQGVDHG